MNPQHEADGLVLAEEGRIADLVASRVSWHVGDMDHIEIVPYQPSWPAAFLQERKRLETALSGEEILAIEHFGSTAIPAMPAKPIIDILIGVPAVRAARRGFPATLEKLGYDFWAVNPKDDRLFFVKGMPPRGDQRTHHVHVCERPSEMWGRLVFRDYLRAHSEAATEYAALKQGLSITHRDDREAYTKAKDEFVAKIMAAARN